MSEYSWKQKWTAVVPKPFAILSILGSLYIIRHVLRSPKRRGSVLHRILLGLSIYDCLASTALLVGTWAIPRGTPDIFMAWGNDATCITQGFFVQLGVGTPLYNASLATYYFLVVAMGWKEQRLQKVEPILHLFPILFSLGTAIIVAATNAYHNSMMWCWITPSNNAFRFGFFYGPVWVAMTAVTMLMAGMYTRVHLQERKIRMYIQPEQRFSSGKVVMQTKMSHSRKVAAQAMFYVFSFYLTFVFPSWTRVAQLINGSTPFVAIALFSIFAPMQGFFNCMVYCRPRYLRYREEHPELSFFQLISRVVRDSSESRLGSTIKGRVPEQSISPTTKQSDARIQAPPVILTV